MPTAARSAARQPALHVFKANPPSSPGGERCFCPQGSYTGLTFSPGTPLLRAVNPKEAPPHRSLPWPLSSGRRIMAEGLRGGGIFSAELLKACY